MCTACARTATENRGEYKIKPWGAGGCEIIQDLGLTLVCTRRRRSTPCVHNVYYMPVKHCVRASLWAHVVMGLAPNALKFAKEASFKDLLGFLCCPK